MAKKVLIADDDPAIVDSLQMMLEQFGYDVSTTTDGETFTKTRTEQPDVLLLDIWMSGEDGRDVCRKLKAAEDTKHIPIVMISASKDVEKSAKEAGSDDFLAKPFEMDDLLQKVATYTKN